MLAPSMIKGQITAHKTSTKQKVNHKIVAQNYNYVWIALPISVLLQISQNIPQFFLKLHKIKILLQAVVKHIYSKTHQSHSVQRHTK